MKKFIAVITACACCTAFISCDGKDSSEDENLWLGNDGPIVGRILIETDHYLGAGVVTGTAKYDVYRTDIRAGDDVILDFSSYMQILDFREGERIYGDDFIDLTPRILADNGIYTTDEDYIEKSRKFIKDNSLVSTITETAKGDVVKAEFYADNEGLYKNNDGKYVIVSSHVEMHYKDNKET